MCGVVLCWAMYCAMYGPGMSDVRAMLGDVWAMHTPEMETYRNFDDIALHYTENRINYVPTG